mgnify:CR=1 FL=1
MLKLSQTFLPLFIRIFFVLILFILCRAIGGIYYYEAFQNVPFSEVISLLLYGLRSDLSAVIYINLVFIFLSLIPFSFVVSRAYQ